VSNSLFAVGRRAHVVRAAAAVALVLGYADMAHGGITAAPVLLVIAYVVLVPLAILGD
jgi:hypothetical protein